MDDHFCILLVLLLPNKKILLVSSLMVLVGD